MQWHRQRARLEELNAEVLQLTFASETQAAKWRDDAHVSFRILCDSDRHVYSAYGLESSFLRSWQPRVWLHYARLLLGGRAWRGIQGDSGQLGGDFIIVRQGIVRLAHRSQDPTDRPSVHGLLAEVERIAGL